MKSLMTATAMALALGAGAAQAEGDLILYNWFEYMPQEVLDKFTAETGITVTTEIFDSNEAMLATLKAGNIGSYDVAVPGDYMVEIMIGEGLLQPINADLGNHGNIDDNWNDPAFDPGRQYSVPYQWGSTTFMVDTAAYGGDIDTLSILFDPPAELKGRINMADSPADVLVNASMFLGIPQCTTDREQLKALDALVNSAKENWASFNSETSRDVLASGDVLAGMAASGDGAKARADKPSLKYAFPKEGYVVWMDNLVLLKDAPNRENALKFLDFMLEPENIAIVSNWAGYGAAVTGVEKYLTPELAALPEANPHAEAGAPTFVQACEEETQAVYDQIWTRVKQ